MLFELSLMLPILGFLGFNFGKQDSEAKSESGLRGTKYFDDTAAGANSALQQNAALTNEIQQSPYGSFRGQTGSSMFDAGQFGLGTAADEAVKKLLSQSSSRMSASAGARGQLSPENIPGVAASATRQVLPQLLPQISEMSKWIYQLPELWKNSLFNYGSSLASSYAPYLGANSSSNSSGFNVGMQVGGSSMLPGTAMGGG